MNQATSAEDRLPWLNSPRPAKGAKPRPAARGARTPLLTVLGLFFAGAIAVMAYLAGRGTAPVVVAPPITDSRPVAPAQVPAPVPPLPVAPPAPIVAAPEPAAAPAPAAAPEPAAKPRATRPTAKLTASDRRSVTRSKGVTINRNTPQARPIVPRYRWPEPSTAGPSGHVIQLGAYVTGRQTMAAWRRLRVAYPSLTTLPRRVTLVSPGEGRPLYYRLRIGARSADHARAICDNLHRIGRGCIVV